MTQEVKIGVNANTGGGVAGIGKIEGAFDDAAAAAGGIADSVAGAGRKIDDATSKAEKLAEAFRKVELSAERVAAVQSLLTRDLGRSVSGADTERFLQNYERMRTGGGVGSQRLRGFDSFENWRVGNRGTFKSDADADRHRRYVMSVGMQGTAFSQKNQPPAGGGQDEGGGPFSNGVNRAKSASVSFGKSMLALAGITTVGAMAAKGVDMAREEAIGTDTLMRLSNLGQSFDALEKQTRAATDGMGLTFVESTRLALQFAKTSGTVGSQAALTNSYNFARRYGVDPSASVQTFATMQRLGVTKDDPTGAKFANLIGEAVEKGGYGGKVDDLLAAVTDFASGVARTTFTTPNVAAFASYLTGISKTGYAGTDPSGGAALLSTVNSSISQGGGRGAASLNFTMSALNHATPGMSPLDMEALYQSGAMGTTRSVFGKGTPLGDDYRRRGLPTPALDDVTNLQKEVEQIKRMYKGKDRNLAAAGQFGISDSAAALLLNMTPEQLTGQAKQMSGKMPGSLGNTTREDAALMLNTLSGLGTALLYPLNEIQKDVHDIAQFIEGVPKDPKAAAQTLFGQKNNLFGGMTSTHGNVTADMLKYMDATDDLLHVPRGSTRRQLYAESGLNTNVKNSSAGAMGLAQIMPATNRSLEKRWGGTLDPHDPKVALAENRALMEENMKRSGGDYNKALQMYNSSYANWNNADSRKYADSITGGQHITGEVHLNVLDSSHKVVGVAKLRTISKPAAAGTGTPAWVGGVSH